MHNYRHHIAHAILNFKIYGSFLISAFRLKIKHCVHLLSIYTPQETDTADKGMGDDTSSTTALLESASLGCGEGEREREREREREVKHHLECSLAYHVFMCNIKNTGRQAWVPGSTQSRSHPYYVHARDAWHLLPSCFSAINAIHPSRP